MWKDRAAYMMKHFGEEVDFIVGPMKDLRARNGEYLLIGEDPNVILFSRRRIVKIILHPKLEALEGAYEIAKDVAQHYIDSGSVAEPHTLERMRATILAKLQAPFNEAQGRWPFQNQFRQKRINGGTHIDERQVPHKTKKS